MVIDRELIPHHSDDIGPAIDGDAGQTAHILARFIKVPRAVVVPAVIQEALRKLIRFVVVIDVERGQIQNVALVHGVKGNRLVGGLHVAVAVDNHLYDLLLRGVGHIDVGPAVDSISFRELIPGAVGIPLEPLVVGVAVAIQVFDIFFQIVDHVFTVEGLTGIQHIVISLHAVGDAIDHHALIVGDHADNVGPAADGDGLTQRVVGVAGLVIIPAAVVVPALELIVLVGRSTLSVVVRDLQLRNINGIADFVIPHYRNRCIGCGGIAVAIDDYIDSLILRGIFNPSCCINRIIGHSSGNSGIPSSECISLAARSPLKGRSHSTRQQSTGNLIGKDFLTVHTVGIGYSIGGLFIIRRTIVVLIVLPLRHIGHSFGYRLRNFRVPSHENIVLTFEATFKFRSCAANQQVSGRLVFEDCLAVYTVSIGYGIGLRRYVYSRTTIQQSRAVITLRLSRLFVI